MQSFSFIHLMAFEKKIFYFFFFSKIYPFGSHGNQSKSATGTKFIRLVEDYSRNISVKLVFKISAVTAINANFHFSHVTAINANFHFSHCKSMEILSYHANESTWATTIKSIIYVEANSMNLYAKFQLHPQYSFWGEDFLNIFWKIYPLCCHGNQSNSVIWTKFIWIVEDYSSNISAQKKKSKYLQRDSKNWQFPLFPL